MSGPSRDTLQRGGRIDTPPDEGRTAPRDHGLRLKGPARTGRDETGAELAEGNCDGSIAVWPELLFPQQSRKLPPPVSIAQPKSHPSDVWP